MLILSSVCCSCMDWSSGHANSELCVLTSVVVVWAGVGGHANSELRVL